MPILSVKNLIKKFGKPPKEFVAVNDISFDLTEGEILGLLGPNGAGKTTTIQMLLGVLTPTSGKIEYFGKDLSKERQEILEEVNFSSTYTNLPWKLTVEENLMYTAYLYNIKDRRKRFKEISRLFRLDKLLHQTINELSAGQLTRVNLAKAFINFPRILLLDEPTASLDPEVADYIRSFLLNQRSQFKVSIIITSHNMTEVEEVCDRVLFIKDGAIVANDTPTNLARRVNVSHVSLIIKDGIKKAAEVADTMHIKHEVKSRYFIAHVDEKRIPDFLKELLSKGVEYEEISIDKPSLEDYFLQVTTENKRHEAT